ncbi:hypothetical protein GCM10010106_46610 [Thermopolyspora flexuosa]|nr:hypothetical protein GCM10010106_46610 [Thermopolyspora flexuosa]
MRRYAYLVSTSSDTFPGRSVPLTVGMVTGVRRAVAPTLAAVPAHPRVTWRLAYSHGRTL